MNSEVPFFVISEGEQVSKTESIIFPIFSTFVSPEFFTITGISSGKQCLSTTVPVNFTFLPVAIIAFDMAMLSFRVRPRICNAVTKDAISRSFRFLAITSSTISLNSR